MRCSPVVCVDCQAVCENKVGLPGTHRWGLRGPAGGTDLPVGLDKLERLHQAKGLLDAAADRQVVHAHVLHHAVRVDDEQTPERQTNTLFTDGARRAHTFCRLGTIFNVSQPQGDARPLQQDPVVSGNLFVEVRQ